ncbi:MAG TPA: FG-GAP-like repeat-containing protein [Bryobacteraceae bacterium]|nr:FG-GAP-like repeat-containing protein [Bryobacteraceae bacterium]
MPPGRRRFLIVLVIAVSATLTISSALAAGPNFVPDYILKGSSLNGWHTSGQAEWRAKNGELTGTPKDAGGGWLVLDKSFQDAAFFADVYCTGACDAGILFRLEKTADGMKGIYFSIKPGDLGSYAVTLDSSGRIVHRQKLSAAHSNEALGNSPIGKGGLNRNPLSKGFNIGVLPLPAGIHLPELKRPTGDYIPDDWNGVEVLMSGDALRPALNGGALQLSGNPISGAVTDAMGAYGPIAIYAGGSGDVRLKNVCYKDLLRRSFPREYLSKNYRMQRLDAFYYSWSAAVADVNRDGVPDIIAGPYVYLGPDYTEAQEIYTPVAYNPTTDYPQVSMVNLAYDFTGDGWPDVLVMSGNAGNGTGTLYVNPRGESRHWAKYVVLQPVGNEDTLLKDIDGDGKPEVIHAGNNTLQYSKPDPANPTGRWITKTISEPGPWGANIGHGLGVGDINGDGRMDFLNAYGWWEQPPPGSSQKVWTYHPQAFGRWGHSQGGAGGAEIGVYDVNGDGLNDVVTALEGHAFGLAWYEQKRDSTGKISFVQHMIMDNFLTRNAGSVTFTEPHATAFADMDGDGIPDMITGKRAMSHLFGYSDPDPFGPAVLYVYKTVRNRNAPGGAEFVPELVHNRSGVGSHLAVVDLNGDGTPDIVTSGVYGTFIFFNGEHRSQHVSRSVGHE